MFGGDESPSLTPTAAKGAPQERGFLEELFGPDEEPKPAPVAKPAPTERAPKVEEIIPSRPIGGDREPVVTPSATKEPAVETPPHLGRGRFELEPQKATPEEAPAQRTAASTGTWHDDPVIKESRARMEEIRANPPQNSFQLQYYKDALAREDAIIKDRKEEIKYEQSGTVKEFVDADGNKRMMWATGPKAGQLVQAADRETKETHGPDWTKTGEEFISTLPQQDQAYVRGLVNGSIDMPKGVKQNYLVKAAMQAKPGWTPTNYGVLNQTYKEFATTAPTKAGGQLISGNAAINHAGELADLVTQLGNSNVPIWNTITNKIGDESGTEKSNIRQKFNSLLDKYVDEQNKFYKGSPGGVEERKAAHERYNVNKTPQQIIAALAEDQKAMAGKLAPLEERFKTVQKALPEEARKEYDAIGPQAKRGQKQLNDAYEKVYGRKKDLGDEQLVPAETGPTIVRTGILDGRKVIKYSDGTMKYAD